MQRTICNGHQTIHSRIDDPPTSMQAQNVHSTATGGTMSQQLHWKRKILNKQGLNKCRQNPARQAAVRSFRKYHFSNQDFLIRKYLRSVKKQMKSKQCDTSETSTNAANIVAGTCNNNLRSSVGNSCLKQKADIKSKNCTANQNNSSSNVSINNINPALPSTSTNASKHSNNKNNHHQDLTDVASSQHQLVDVDEELKLCELKNWPTCGVEQPTYETVLQDTPPCVSSNQLKDDMKNSTVCVKQYCESIKELMEMYSCTDYKYGNMLDSLPKNNCVNKDLYKGKNSYISGNRSAKINKPKININNNFGEVSYKSNYRISSNSKTGSSCKEFIKDNLEVNGNHYGYNDDDEEDDEDDEEDDEDNDVLGDVDDDDDNEIDGDEEGEDDDVEDEESNNSENDTGCKYRSQRRQKNSGTGNSRQIIHNTKSVRTINKCKRKNKSTGERKRLVVSVDTSDSSSVSSSQDNSSVSTETCCSDIQTIALHESEDSNNNAVSDISDGCSLKSKQRTIVGLDQTQNFIKIRNREYPVSILDNNPTLVEYIESISFEQEDNKRREYSGRPALKKGDVQSLMCNESEENRCSVTNKRNINPRTRRNLRYNSSMPVNSKQVSKCIYKSNEKQGHLAANNNKKCQSAARGKPVDMLEHTLDSRRANNVQPHTKINSRVRGLQKSSANGKNVSYEPLLSHSCSIEDGLAFFDNQNQLATHTIPHTTSEAPHNETITLYNNLTSCTFPVLGNTSGEGKPNLNDENDKCLLFPNSVASQTTLSPARSSHLSFHAREPMCSRCKQIDDKFQESLCIVSMFHLNDLFKSTVVLDSLLTGRCQKEVIKEVMNMS